MSNITLGRVGEDAACQYLESIGYKVIERNFRCQLGEIDLIAQDKNMLVVIEVKTRLSTQCGQPFESVTYFKQQRLIKLAQVYLKFKRGTVDVFCRFDVISIIFKGGDKDIKHIKNAFCVNI